MRARVIIVAGPSGSGKTRLAERLGLPVLRLDDFYRDGDDPAVPRRSTGLVDWDDPRAWDRAAACTAIATLCRDGRTDVPIYDIAADGRVGQRELDLGGSPYFVAEGIFAPEVVEECRTHGLLADAICVRHHRAVTFWRRLTRDLREHRKPPMVLLRRGLRLMRAEPAILRRALDTGCVPATPKQAERRVRALLARPRG
ncbi:MAG: uridine kinase family protein [Nocardioidaceae bacterium]